MKGNAAAHTTNEKYRDGYDRIQWSADPKPRIISGVDYAEVRRGDQDKETPAR